MLPAIAVVAAVLLVLQMGVGPVHLEESTAKGGGSATSGAASSPVKKQNHSAAKSSAAGSVAANAKKTGDTAGTAAAAGQGTAGKRDTDHSLEGKTFRDGVFTGTGTGFRGTITARVTIRGGTIRRITLQNAADDASYFNRARGVVSQILKKQSPDVDAVSGATYSSNGIMEAVEQALKKAAVKQRTAGKTSPSKSKKTKKKTTAGKTKKPSKKTQNVNEYEGEGLYRNGTYEGDSTLSFSGSMRAAVLIQNSKISKITITSEDDAAFLDEAEATLLPLIIKQQKTEGLDTVSGATFSSKGILDSVEKALKKALKEIK